MTDFISLRDSFRWCRIIQHGIMNFIAVNIFCLRVYPQQASRKWCRLQRASSGEYIRKYRCERHVSFWSAAFGFWEAGFEDHIGIWKILLSLWQFNIDCQTIDERILLGTLLYSLLARVQDTHTCTDPRFPRLLISCFSRSHRYLKNSVEFTAVQYWLSNNRWKDTTGYPFCIHLLPDRVQDTHPLRTRTTKFWCQMDESV